MIAKKKIIAILGIWTIAIISFLIIGTYVPMDKYEYGNSLHAYAGNSFVDITETNITEMTFQGLTAMISNYHVTSGILNGRAYETKDLVSAHYIFIANILLDILPIIIAVIASYLVA